MSELSGMIIYIGIPVIFIIATAVISNLLLLGMNLTPELRRKYRLWTCIYLAFGSFTLLVVITVFSSFVFCYLIPLFLVFGYFLASKTSSPNIALKYMAVGLVWSLYSVFILVIMGGGYNEPPTFLKVVAFPAWISIDTSYNLYANENSLIQRYFYSKEFCDFCEEIWTSYFEPMFYFLFPLLIGGFVGYIAYGFRALFKESK